MSEYKIKTVNTSSILKSKAKFTLKNRLGTIQFCLQAIYCLQYLDLLNASKPRVLIIYIYDAVNKIFFSCPILGGGGGGG